MALGTVLWQFITSITAVILAITEQPLGDAPVVGRSWTSLPPSSAVTLPVSVKNTYVSDLHSSISPYICIYWVQAQFQWRHLLQKWWATNENKMVNMFVVFVDYIMILYRIVLWTIKWKGYKGSSHALTDVLPQQNLSYVSWCSSWDSN